MAISLGNITGGAQTGFTTSAAGAHPIATISGQHLHHRYEAISRVLTGAQLLTKSR
jgi:hypothetical protein